ncbi:major facilitator superfamily domain-containing protein [Xylariaceae sp. FL0804]|nr:major facilitator superfamily domain-containing protein [Xylariaceae sp. FL0804]
MESADASYPGRGTPNDPFLVTFSDDDPRDPMRMPRWLRWVRCVAAGFVTFSVAFISSSYSGGIRDISDHLGASPELVTLGMSLFLLGFVLGPFLWAPLSELFGRRSILLYTGTLHVALNIAICFSWSIHALLLLRLFSGAFGAATLTNSGGVIADIFPPRERGLAVTVYALVPLFAPVLGPIVGAYVSSSFGWRWAAEAMALLSASALAVGALALPETYAPVLLAKRARKLARLTGKSYVSAMAASAKGSSEPEPSLWVALGTNLARPFRLAVNEPIVGFLALYQAIVFGTLYLTFTAYPIIYTDILGWPSEHSGLSFMGVLVGLTLSVIFAVWDNARYVRGLEKLSGTTPPPESRLPACCLGGVCIVIGLFSFAWSASSGAHWLVNMATGVPFGFGIVLVTIGSTNYIVDSYTTHAASALAVCICGRAVCGAVFPLFVQRLFVTLGVWWSLTIPAFLSLMCAIFPFVFYRYGPSIRARCKFAGQAELAACSARQRVDEATPLLF